MRVIGGKYRGQKLKSPRGMKVRPITDRVKESLFGYLGAGVEGASVLDLFAGTGSLGIEALSRGAEFVCFVEKHAPTVRIIKENLRRVGAEERAKVITAELPRLLVRLKGDRGRYDLIFLDPPFRIDFKVLAEIFQGIVEGDFLAEGVQVVYRHSPHLRYNPPEEMWSLTDRRSYGDSVISLFEVVKEA